MITAEVPLSSGGADSVAPGLERDRPTSRDVAGFGISDNQSKLTYNLTGGLEWRFRPSASALVGWRYMNIDLEKGSGARTFNADIEMNGPFLGLSLYF